MAAAHVVLRSPGISPFTMASMMSYASLRHTAGYGGNRLQCQLDNRATLQGRIRRDDTSGRAGRIDARGPSVAQAPFRASTRARTASARRPASGLRGSGSRPPIMRFSVPHPSGFPTWGVATQRGARSFSHARSEPESGPTRWGRPARARSPKTANSPPKRRASRHGRKMA